MDRELETYVENVMEKQQYRSGIFTCLLYTSDAADES